MSIIVIAANVDVAAERVQRAANKIMCRETLDMQIDRVEHFKRRITELGRSPLNTVIVLANADDVHGGPIADALMPNHNWQAYRDMGTTPFARGLAVRKYIEDTVDFIDTEAGEKLRKVVGVAVVVIDHTTVEIFEV